MTSPYEPAVRNAVRQFWDIREQQAQAQRERGTSDSGTRGDVTAGGHLMPMADVLNVVIRDAGIDVQSDSRTLPGYYRATKNWDGVVTHKGELVAILELKSHVGSLGNNQNNRIEEMIGQARDITMATRHNLLGRLPSWFGYMMIVEDNPESRASRPPSATNTAFPTDSDFASAPSYIDRYAIAFHRLRLHGDLNASCLLATASDKRDYWYPDETMSFDAFATALQSRARDVLAAVG